MRKINRIGQRFGRLLVIGAAPSLKGGRTQWLCKCDCGNEKVVPSGALAGGSTQSCGCLGREQRIKRNTKHGQARRGRKTREYNLWVAAKKRAREQGLLFTITLEDIIIPQVCPVFGLPLCVGTQEEHDNGPSLDRKNPKKGYIPNNVWVISYRANRVKNDATLEELEALVSAMKNGQ